MQRSSDSDFFSKQSAAKINKEVSRFNPFREHLVGVIIILNVELDYSGDMPFKDASIIIKTLKACQEANIPIGIQTAIIPKQGTVIPSVEVLRCCLLHDHGIEILNREKTKQLRKEYQNKQIFLLGKNSKLSDLKAFLEPHINTDVFATNSYAVTIPKKYFSPVELGISGTLVMKYPELICLLQAHQERKLQLTKSGSQNSFRSGAWGIATSTSVEMISRENHINDTISELFRDHSTTINSSLTKEDDLYSVNYLTLQMRKLIDQYYASTRSLYKEELKLEPHQMVVLAGEESVINYAKQLNYAVVEMPRDGEKDSKMSFDHMWELEGLLGITDVLEQYLTPAGKFPPLDVNEKDNKFLQTVRAYYLTLQQRLRGEIVASFHDVNVSSFRELSNEFDVKSLICLQSIQVQPLQRLVNSLENKSKKHSSVADDFSSEEPQKSIYDENYYLMPTFSVKSIKSLTTKVKDSEIAGINIFVVAKDDQEILDLVPYYKNIPGSKTSDHVTVFPYLLGQCEQGQPINIAFIKLNDKGELELNFADAKLIFPYLNVVGFSNKNKMLVAIRSADPQHANTLMVSEKFVYRNFDLWEKAISSDKKTEKPSLPLSCDKFKVIMLGLMLKTLHIEQECLQGIKKTLKDAASKAFLNVIFSSEKSDALKKKAVTDEFTSASSESKKRLESLYTKTNEEEKSSYAPMKTSLADTQDSDNESVEVSKDSVGAMTPWAIKSAELIRTKPRSNVTFSPWVKSLQTIYDLKSELSKCFVEYKNRMSDSNESEVTNTSVFNL